MVRLFSFFFMFWNPPSFFMTYLQTRFIMSNCLWDSPISSFIRYLCAVLRLRGHFLYHQCILIVTKIIELKEASELSCAMQSTINNLQNSSCLLQTHMISFQNLRMNSFASNKLKTLPIFHSVFKSGLTMMILLNSFTYKQILDFWTSACSIYFDLLALFWVLNYWLDAYIKSS